MILPNIAIPYSVLLISGATGIAGAIGGGFFLGPETIRADDPLAVKIAKVVSVILVGALMLGSMPIAIFGIVHIKGPVLGIALLTITILKNL